MVLVSVDPASNESAVTVFANGLLIHWQMVESTTANIKFFFHMLDGSDFLLAVEDQYFGNNVKTLKSLNAIKTRWITLAELAGGIGYYEIMPSAWQRAVLGVVPKGKTKEYSLAKANNNGFVVSNHNLADAYNIGVYVLENYARLSVVTFD